MRRLLLLALLTASTAPRARAYDAATTHAGLTEVAALRSSLARVLASRFGRPLGLYEPLRLQLDGERGRRIDLRLARLDAGAAYAPRDGRLSAIGWLVAGAVVEEAEPARGRHHYFEPATGQGLHQGGLFAGFGLRAGAVTSGGGTLRGLFTGGGFDGTGMASVAWLTSEANDLQLERLLDAEERAATMPGEPERDGALAEALLIAGALLNVIQDAADPAHVRNDYRIANGRDGGHYVRFVAERYGRLGVPSPEAPAKPLAQLAHAIHSPAGDGLADRTARRFFSDGTLPEQGERPSLPVAAAAGAGERGYVSAPGIPHLAAWRREAGEVRWLLDPRCDADYAAALLPEAAQATLSALEHLLRGELVLREGALHNGEVALGPGRLRLLAEDNQGGRRELAARDLTGAAVGDRLLDATLPDGARRLIGVFRGRDANGAPLVAISRLDAAPSRE